MKKDRLRSLAREFSDNAIVEAAQGITPKESAGMSEDTKQEVRAIYCELFEVSDAKEIAISDLL